MRLFVWLCVVLVSLGMRADDRVLTNALVFDPQFYVERHAEVRKATGGDHEKATEHWLTKGIEQGLHSAPDFDVSFYLKTNGDLLKAFGEDGFRDTVKHYVHNGHKEGRQAIQK